MTGSPPTVLLVTSDQWCGRWLGSAGNTHIQTPTLDKLAGNGVRFSRAYSAHPICIPARRSLMTGTTGRTHGDRVFNTHLPMPNAPTLAGTFADAGYQTYAVGKLHVYPQRDRIGFDDALLYEEGRHLDGLTADDWEMTLADEGFAGAEYAHALGTNDYQVRPWHLPERVHPTSWQTRELCRAIRRRDPTRPGFYYLSYNFPHPPLVPLPAYLEMYANTDMPPAATGDWSAGPDKLPYALQRRRDRWPGYAADEIALARRGFHALCTHIDHQLRLVIGTLREEGLLDNTIIAFTADHGDMLGAHGQYAKGLFYEQSANVPFILMPTAEYRHLGHHRVDDRLVELRDVMPTLLEMAGIPIPPTVEGMSLLSSSAREYLYGEFGEGETASRMIREGRHKLIYYPVGNVFQVFDVAADPDESHDLAGDPARTAVLDRLTTRLIGELYGSDLDWLADGRLVGLPDRTYEPEPDRGLIGQRGWRFI